jgi:hypothetical protein
MKTLSIAAAAASTLALLLGAVAPASAAVPETELRPADLDRGPDIAVPHLEGKTVVDGAVRIRVRAGLVTLLGKSESSGEYVVGTSSRTGDARFRVFRVDADGNRTPLLRGVPIWGLVLSQDGTQLGLATSGREHSRVRVWSAEDGHRQAVRRFAGSISILDFDETRMVLGGWGPDRTFWWNTRTDGTLRIADRAGYAADIRARRVATYTKDPYLDGCTVVTTLAPQERLWRSCRERVAEFSPSGARMATIHILSDGIGPRDVWLRRDGGRALAHYSTAGWFGALTWETRNALLLDTVGARKAATVRCVVADCERASDLRPKPDLRPAA